MSASFPWECAKSGSPLTDTLGGVGGTKSSVESIECEGDNIGVVNGVGTVSLTLGEADCAFFCFFETHGVPCSSCTYRGAISIP